MGCGQSKINLYPRRNKNGGKGNSAKKSGAADKEADEEEGSAGGAGGAEGAVPDDPDEDVEQTKHILPLAHPSVIEISASQQDFFKLLDEKIEKGKEYDSSSETEIMLEQDRRRLLIDQWRSASQTSQSFQSDTSPPTPARRRAPRPLPQTPERQSSPGSVRRYCRQQHVPDGMSPPSRRAHSAQAHHQPDPRQINGDNWNDANKSPVRRPQSAGANWKNNPKVAPFNQKPKKNEANEHQRANQKEPELSGSSQDISQTTFKPTFQSQSPAHSAKNQPYIAQIMQYPMSQQVTPPSPPKYIAPPEEYQDPQNNVLDNKFNMQRTPQTPQVNSQSHIYYIHGKATAQVTQDLAQQRQQTAIHLQQYVAMKQAQQQMFSYLQRGPHTLFPSEDYVTANTNRMYESEESQQPQYHPAMRPYSAPTPAGMVRPMSPAPNFTGMPEGSHMVQMPVWTHMPPVVSTMGPWVPGQVPPEMQYYPQSQYMQIHRPHSAGSAGTLTRYQKKDTSDSEVKNNMCQSINLVRQKPIGQIVSLPGQELTVCNNLSDSSSPASVSTDSGVSPGHSEPRTKFSAPPALPAHPAHAPPAPPHAHNDYNNSLHDKVKKNKTAPITRSLKNSKSLDA